MLSTSAYYFWHGHNAYGPRYLAGAIVATEKRDAIVQALAEEETALAGNGSIVSLGRRFLAARPQTNAK